jgi:hypothetical protein
MLQALNPVTGAAAQCNKVLAGTAVQDVQLPVQLSAQHAADC